MDEAPIIESLCSPYAHHPHVCIVKQLMIALHCVADVIDDAVDIGLIEDRIRMLKVCLYLGKLLVVSTSIPRRQQIILGLIHKWCAGNNPHTDTIQNIGLKYTFVTNRRTFTRWNLYSIYWKNH